MVMRRSSCNRGIYDASTFPHITLCFHHMPYAYGMTRSHTHLHSFGTNTGTATAGVAVVGTGTGTGSSAAAATASAAAAATVRQCYPRGLGHKRCEWEALTPQAMDARPTRVTVPHVHGDA